MIKSLDQVVSSVQSMEDRTIAVAQAADHDVLQVADQALKMGLAKFIFVGDEAQINSMIEDGGYDLEDVEIVQADSEAECAALAAELVKTGKANIPMKGLLSTANFMRAMLDREKGFRSNKLISQISVVDNIEGTGLNFITDCALNISPDLNEKKAILENAVYAAQRLGYDCPKVAVLAAVETVNPEAMPETLHAAALSKMNDRGQIKGCIVDGPFALDNAISEESAQHKGVVSPVAGKADILLASDIRMANVLHKAVSYYAGKPVGSIMVGTTVPLVMTSRSDSVEDKLISIALSVFMD